MSDESPDRLKVGDADSLVSSIRAGELSASVLDAIPGIALVLFDQDLRVVLAAGGAFKATGYDVEEIRGRLVEEVVPADTFEALGGHYRAAVDGESGSFEYRTLDGDRWYLLETMPLRDGDGGIAAGAALAREITHAKQAETALRDANRRFEAAFEGAAIGMALVSTEGRFLQVNRSLCEIVGYEAEQLLSKTFQDITHPEDLDADLDYLRETLAGERRTYQMEKRYITADGEHVWVLLAVSLVRDESGEPMYFVSQIEDISERKRIEQRLQYLADHDDLTGLWNRRRFEEEVERQIGRCRRYDERAAVLLIDIDDFKRFNDTHGHAFGDEVLRHLGEVMQTRLRRTDALCRIGGDEFAVLMPHVSASRARTAAESLIASLRSAPLAVKDGIETASASIGVAVIDAEIADLDQVLTAADKAMYEAKRSGGDGVA